MSRDLQVFVVVVVGTVFFKKGRVNKSQKTFAKIIRNKRESVETILFGFQTA
jgi:hypothetical protein